MTFLHHAVWRHVGIAEKEVMSVEKRRVIRLYGEFVLDVGIVGFAVDERHRANDAAINGKGMVGFIVCERDSHGVYRVIVSVGGLDTAQRSAENGHVFQPSGRSLSSFQD